MKRIMGVIQDTGDSPERRPVFGTGQIQINFSMLKEGVDFGIEELLKAYKILPQSNFSNI